MERSKHMLSNASSHELGTLICAQCGTVYATIPTDGYKKIYGQCKPGEGCRQTTTAEQTAVLVGED